MLACRSTSRTQVAGSLLVKMSAMASSGGRDSAAPSAFEVCRISNAAVDVSSWRAILLAISAVNSRVIEVDVHSCVLSPLQITELAKALEKHLSLAQVR